MEKEPVKGDDMSVGLDPVKKATGKTLGEWYKEFKIAPFVVLSFIFAMALVYQNNSIKSGWQIERAELKNTIAIQAREKFVSDSTYQMRLDNAIYLGQSRADRIQASKDSVLILLGAKKALEK